ncbi:MAG: hypothetical protein AAFU41_12830, partial [Pseudomonadota bacterium]
MGQNLDRFVNYLLVAEGSIGTLRTTNAVIRKTLLTYDDALGDLLRVTKSADDLNEFAKDLKSAVLLIKFFPPTKTIGKLALEVVELAQSRTAAFSTKLKDLRGVISDQREGITRLIERIDSFDEKLEYAQYGVLGTLAGALVVQKAIDVFGPDAPPAVQAANATIETKLQVATDNLMTNFNAPDLETAFAGFDTDFDAMLAGISGFGSLGSVLRTIEREFNNVYSKIAFLDGPLDGLVDALDGFFWVLE